MARPRPAPVDRPRSVTARPRASRRGVTWILAALLGLSLLGNYVLARRAFAAQAAPPPSPPTAAPAAVSAPTAVEHARGLSAELTPYAALGTYIAANNRIPDLEWSTAQFDAFVAGLRACYLGRPYPFDEPARELRDAINHRVETMIAGERPDPVEEYFVMLRDNEGVQRTASNLHFRITEVGAGATPTATDTVVVSYAARLPSGETLPGLSRARLQVKVTDLLPGLAEGVQLLQPAGKALVYLPPSLSFAPSRWPAEVPRGAPVAFFVELHEIVVNDW